MDLCLSVLYAFPNSWSDCNEIWYRDILLALRAKDRLSSKIISPIPGGAQTDILRFKMEILFIDDCYCMVVFMATNKG